MWRICVLLLAVCNAWGPIDDLVTNLPGTSNIPFKQYAGHINVNPATGRNLFYWFVESQGNPAQDPVIIWLNGGPGCSSLAGFLSELGPFWPTTNGTSLEQNPYTWNLVANVIFLDSPSGVGFSYSTNPSDYNVGDARTADDAYNFLLAFFQAYPQFASNPFWVTGESYAGHYVPNLAVRIVEGNRAGGNPKINIQGFMVGNAWTDTLNDNLGMIFDWWSHALNSDSTYNGMVKYCNWSLWYNMPTEGQCGLYANRSTIEMGNINLYFIYQDVCLSNSLHQGQMLLRQLARGEEHHPTTILARALVDREERLTQNFGPTPPCIGNYVADYLNRADVRQALHATMPNYPWTDCSAIVNYNMTDMIRSIIPMYEYAIAAKLRILVYSGDVDGVVPTPGTRNWLKLLNLDLVDPWRPWISSQQVGGYTEQYSELTFATVRGAGHMVPGFQPERAFDMFSRFLAGQPL